MSFELRYYELGSVRTWDAFSVDCGLCTLGEIKITLSVHTQVYKCQEQHHWFISIVIWGLACVVLRHISGYLNVDCCTAIWKLHSTISWNNRYMYAYMRMHLCGVWFVTLAVLLHKAHTLLLKLNSITIKRPTKLGFFLPINLFSCWSFCQLPRQPSLYWLFPFHIQGKICRLLMQMGPGVA